MKNTDEVPFVFDWDKGLVPFEFKWGSDHFSPGHANHRPPDSTSAIQRDLFVRLQEGGRFERVLKVGSPSGTEVQTKLWDFDRGASDRLRLTAIDPMSAPDRLRLTAIDPMDRYNSHK